jgi:4-hydroxythreonine-4-phosphate dehydrogenase
VTLPARPTTPRQVTTDGVPFLDLLAPDRTWTLGEVSPAAGRAVGTWQVLRAIRLAHRVASGAGGNELRIGVAALNPHAGEGGLLGDEEERVITPAVVAAITEGINAMGPIPADHIFRQARAGRFDVVVSMHHDQAQIATKLLGFEMGVSVGTGLPFPMTTPSHGTAFDIAGQGAADAAHGAGPPQRRGARRIACGRPAVGRNPV